MSSKVQELTKKKLINPPSWILDSQSICYETVTGSITYGISTDSSDTDIFCIAVPPKEIIFPHLAGDIPGLKIKQSELVPKFTNYEKHHVNNDGDIYDISIKSIIEFFNLCIENNPNIMDCLHVSENFILKITDAGKLIRENRNVFLHRGSLHKFIGYAYSQLNKMKNKTEDSARYQDILEHGYDLKFGCHVVRLLDQCMQLLSTGEMDITINKEKLKSIRRGEWSEDQIRQYFADQEPALRRLYETSPLPLYPDTKKIKSLLLDALEAAYGSLYCATCALKYDSVVDNENQRILDQIRQLLK